MKTANILATISALLLLAGPVPAHHGYAAYDMQSTKSLKGTVTNYEMVNPHSQIDIDVKATDGTVEHWVIECLGVRSMQGQGFKYDTLKPGDEVSVSYSPAKNGAHSGVMIKITLPDGTVLPKSGAN